PNLFSENFKLFSTRFWRVALNLNPVFSMSVHFSNAGAKVAIFSAFANFQREYFYRIFLTFA
ncbi:MAG: hypothetical protein ACO1N9_09300, partial [Flavobacterium sp.]